MALSFAVSAAALAQSPARQAGKAAGEFGAGVGEAFGEGVTQGMSHLQPEWITVPPRSKEECMAESGGVVNPVFVRCRNGRQEYVKTDRQGNRSVLRERPIPMR
ncbi:MAG TPA: hypothetical protein VJM31_12520 [Vicinamibacterales bacterium]|nr:hypothetical protein [Vicinamibacterales bacterium]